MNAVERISSLNFNRDANSHGFSVRLTKSISTVPHDITGVALNSWKQYLSSVYVCGCVF